MIPSNADEFSVESLRYLRACHKECAAKHDQPVKRWSSAVVFALSMTVSGWVGYGIWFACAIGLEKLADLTPVATGTGAAIAGLTGFMSFMRDNAVTSGNADRIMVVEYTAILFDKGITDSDDDLSG